MGDGTTAGGNGMPWAVGSDQGGRRACAEWGRLAGPGRLPRLADRRPDDAAILPLDGEEVGPIPADLARLIRRHAADLGRPMRFQADLADLADRATATDWSGLLLPYADENGRLAAVAVLAHRRSAVSAAERQRLAADMISAWPTVGPATEPGNPWRTSPPSTAGKASVDPADAPLWAALAASGPIGLTQAIACARVPVPAGLAGIDRPTGAGNEASAIGGAAGPIDRLVLVPMALPRSSGRSPVASPTAASPPTARAAWAA